MGNAEEIHEHQMNTVINSVKKDQGRKRCRPDNVEDQLDPDEEYVSSLLLYREQVKVKVSDINTLNLFWSNMSQKSF